MELPWSVVRVRHSSRCCRSHCYEMPVLLCSNWLTFDWRTSTLHFYAVIISPHHDFELEFCHMFYMSFPLDMCPSDLYLCPSDFVDHVLVKSARYSLSLCPSLFVSDLLNRSVSLQFGPFLSSVVDQLCVGPNMSAFTNQLMPYFGSGNFQLLCSTFCIRNHKALSTYWCTDANTHEACTHARTHACTEG